ncbi:MAG: carbohydrate ABC transporter permease [Chloroflexi bacterium]|nr:carbohydrate ABC transporter permease [Chloroflexota bacterium]
MRHIRQSPADILWNAINYTALVVVSLVCLYPFIWVLSCSLSNPEEVLKGTVLLWPRRPELATYRVVASFERLWIGYANTIYYTVLGTAINVAMTLVVSYPLSRTWVRGRGAVSGLIIFTMLFSGGMIPTYLVIKMLGMVNTRWAMLIPGAISAWNLILTRTYLTANVPDELVEAAAMDGANDLRTFWSVVLPLSGPIIAVITLFYAVGHWNDLFTPLLYLNEPKMFPLTIVLRDITMGGLSRGGFTDSFAAFTSGKTRFLYSMNLKYAAIMVASLPIMCLYPFLQRYFIKGVMVGALKG